MSQSNNVTCLIYHVVAALQGELSKTCEISRNEKELHLIDLIADKPEQVPSKRLLAAVGK